MQQNFGLIFRTLVSGQMVTVTNRMGKMLYYRRNPKGDGGKGTGKKMSQKFATNVTRIYDMSRQFATFYDNFRLFIPLT